MKLMTHNIYNLLESESEGEVDRLAVVEHRSLQARRQRTVTFFILFPMSKTSGCHRQRRVTFYSFFNYKMIIGLSRLSQAEKNHFLLSFLNYKKHKQCGTWLKSSSLSQAEKITFYSVYSYSG